MNNSVVLLATFMLAIAAVAVALIVVKAKSSGASPIASTFDPEQLLSPIREQIGVIVSRLDDTSKALTETRTSISLELGNVLTVSNDVRDKNEQLAITTERISTALQGSGTRGNWGQVSLRRVAEMAGLSQHITFNEQERGRDDEGEFQPDMVVKLPGGRNIVVDAKAPKIDLPGNGNFSTAALLKDHIKDLESRNYGARVNEAIDFTVLFIPSEGVLATALTEDLELSEYAFNKKILLATPMTLLALLRAVEFGWKQSDQMQNVKQILEDAKELCNRFGILDEHFKTVGTALNTLVNNYNNAVNSLNGRLKPQIRKIGQLGLDVKRSQDDFPEVTAQLKSVEIN